MDAVTAMAASPGEVKIAGASFVITPPTPGDLLRELERMRDLARSRVVPPLEYVFAQSDKLAPAALALSVSEAIKLGAGGGVDPTPGVVIEQYTSLEGVRWRAWYHASRALPGLKADVFEKLVTDDNRLSVSDQLDAACKLKAADPNAQGPATGSGS